MNQLLLVFTKLMVFLSVLFIVKPMFPEGTQIRVCLMITSAVQAQFALLNFKPRKISFVVCFTTPSKIPIMFGFMRTIAFYILGSLNFV